MINVNALEWIDIFKLRMTEKEVPTPKEEWVLLKVGYAGICGSELSAYKGENELRKPPAIMGHEFSGTVVISDSTKNADFAGKKVAVNPLVTCGKCNYCILGQEHLCPERKIIGVHYPGAFAEYVTVPAHSCHEVSDLLLGALTEPLATALHAVRMGGIGTSDSVLVIGAGSIGLLVIAVLKSIGVSHVLVADTNKNRLSIAENWGADEVIDPSEYEPGGLKVDSAIDAVGLESTREMAVKSVKPGKSVIFVGLHSPSSFLPGNLIVRNEIKIYGSFAYSNKDFTDAVGILRDIDSPKRLAAFDVRSLDRGDASFKELLGPGSMFAKIILKP